MEDEVHIYGISTAYRLLALSDDDLIVTDVACEALGATARKRSQDTVSPQDFLNSPPQRGEGRHYVPVEQGEGVHAALSGHHQYGMQGDQSGWQGTWSFHEEPHL